MEQGIEPLLGLRIGEDPLSQPAAIELAIGGNDIRAKMGGDGSQSRGAGLHYLAGDDVRIHHLDAQLGKAVGNRGLAAADSPVIATTYMGQRSFC